MQATRNFHKVCLQRRKEFATETPEMLKYQPKRFWGMLQKSQPTTGISAQAFAEFNEKLYYNADLPTDQFTPPADIEAAKIKPSEVKQILEHHYPANKSTGLSNMPTQCIKWLG